MRTICLPSQLLDEAVEPLIGTRLGDTSYDLLLQDDADVYKPNGELLIRFRKQLLPERLLAVAAPALRKAAKTTRNRGAAAGFEDDWDERRGRFRQGKLRYRPVLLDGTVSKTSYAPPAESGVVGYLDRNVRFPYCRLTEFGHDHAQELSLALPLFEACSVLFRELLPDRWMAQMERVSATNAAFVLPNTCFTTVTVNRNFQTAVHKDKGDLKEGFGVMTVMERGKYRGGYFVMPQFRVAVDMRHGDLLLADVHEYHGNTHLLPLTANWERLSLVLYYREKMRLCGSWASELERAKRRRVGDPLDEQALS